MGLLDDLNKKTKRLNSNLLRDLQAKTERLTPDKEENEEAEQLSRPAPQSGIASIRKNGETLKGGSPGLVGAPKNTALITEGKRRLSDVENARSELYRSGGKREHEDRLRAAEAELAAWGERNPELRNQLGEKSSPGEELNYQAGKVLKGATGALQGAIGFADKLIGDDLAILGSLVDATTGRTQLEKPIQEWADKALTTDILGADKFGEAVEDKMADKKPSKVRDFVGGIAESAGAMLPAIATGGAAGAAGLGAGTTQALNYLAFGTGAAGNAAKQALAEGADMSEAVEFGMVSGMMEVLSESMFAGIAGMNPSGVLDDVMKKLTQNGTIQFLGNTLGEGVEETVVEFLTPYIKRATYDPDAANATFADLARSFASGAAMSFLMTGANAIASGDPASVLRGTEGMTEQQILQDKYGRVEEQKVGDVFRNGEVYPARPEISPESGEHELEAILRAAAEEMAREEIQAERPAEPEIRPAEPVSPPAAETVTREEKAPQAAEAEAPAAKETEKPKFGAQGEKVIAEIAERTSAPVEQVAAEAEAAYEAGRADIPREKVSFETPIQEEAYTAGRLDHVADVEQNAENSAPTLETASVGAYTELENELAKSDRVIKDGMLYRITRTKDGFFVSIDRDNSIGNITDARAHIYTGGPFSDQLEAISDALAVARTNFYPDVKEDIANGNIAGEYRENEAGYQGSTGGIREDDSGRTGSSGRSELRPELPVGSDADGRRDRGRGVRELTADEAAALLSYKSGGSYQLNMKLREGVELSDVEQKVVTGLDTALPKLPARKGTLYRNIGFDGFGDQEARDAFMAAHSEGGLTVYPAYTSTSTAVDGYPVEGDYVVHMVIEGETGRDMAGYGNNSESEVLFPRDTYFFVDKIEYGADGTPTIYMTEVNSNGEIDQSGDSGSGSTGSREPRGTEAGNAPGSQEGKVRDVSAVSSENAEVQEVSERDTEGRIDRETELPDVQREVTANNPQRAIAEVLLKYIKGKQDFSAARLFEIADKHYGGSMAAGTYTVKDAYDAMELAVNLYLVDAAFVKKGNGNAASARVTLKRLVEMLRRLPTQTKRTAEMESFQQFSTPPNIAYLAAWTANISAEDVALEPSAGIGGLALWPKAWGAKVYGNELSERRLAFLNELGLDGTYNLNAEQIDNLLPEEIKPSVVIMNPPFSSTAGRSAKNSTANAKRHIEQALDRLEDGGRLVAILGNGMADDAPAFRSWWDELRQEYSVRANIRIDGENYRKYGTTFDVQLVVIDKTGPSSAPTLTGTYKDLAQIPDVMEAIRNDRTRKTAERGILQDGNSVAGSTSESRADNKRGSDEGSAAGTPSDARGSGEQRGKGRKQAASEGEGNRKSVSGNNDRADGGRLAESDTGPRMALSGVAQSDMDGGSVGDLTDNPDSVYASYSPKKVHIVGAKKHPAKLVESAAMAAVEPPAATYTPALPKKLVTGGLLSDAQLENIVYAGQAHEQTLPNGQRKGYFIGDGTGVGKGRQLSGIIMDNFLQGRDRAIWISNSANLYEDAIRDWTDLGGKKDDVLNFSKFKLGQDIKAERGIMFSTYDTIKMEKDAKSRLKDLERWLGKDFDGVICFDEAHNMANATGRQGKRGRTKPSAKALAGIKLQQMFPKARIVYASATGATDISDYAYLERLGLWGPGTAFHNAEDFTSKISTGGLAAMELVARDMKSMGVYMARSISYDDVKYDTLQHDLNPMQTEIYNTMSRAWQTVYQNISKALEITGANKNGNARGAAHSVFYSTQQRFYNQIITSMAMPSVIEDMRKELANGRSCILQIVNTNEAQAERAISAAEKAGLSLDDLDLTPSETLIAMVEKSFPIQEYEEYTDEKGNERSRPVTDSDGNPVLSKKAIRMRDELIADLQQMKVPDGPLEMLFDAFGVDQVAEVTGRSRRVVEKADEQGHMRRVVESRSGKAGIADAQMFQDGKKRILVFSDAGGTGKSYHADLRAKNQQQRVHYLLQPGWNASKATQGFGRSHRSNQAVAPIFRLVTTNVMGQKRFTSTIARRLDQLGALTKGQRQAGSGIFGEKDNLEGPIAQDALQQYYKTVSFDVLKKLGLYNSIYDSSGKLNEGSPDLRDIGKFLNRILSLEVDEQNEVFQGFYDTFDRMMDVAIANGTVDMGLENYRADKIEVKDEKVIRQDASGADTKYVQMTAFHKPELISYSKVQGLHQNFKGLVRTEDGSVRAVYEISGKTNPRTGEIQRRFKLESPVKGKASVFVEKTLNEQTKPVDKSEWKQAWAEETAKAPEYNESVLHLLTGTLLPIWDKLPANNTRVMRVISSDGRQYLGRVIRPDQIDSVLHVLGANRTMQTYTPQQVSEAVLQQGKEVMFRDDRLRLTRRRVSGEWRMELTGQNIWYVARRIPGVIAERINYEYRYFMPTGNNDALQALMDSNPVVDIRESAPEGEVDYMLNGEVLDHSEEWTASRVGSSDKQPMRLSELIEKIRHDFGLNITKGHIRAAGVRGQYDQRNSGARTKIANDLPTVAHELGHHFDREFGLRDSVTEEMKQELLNNMDEQLAASYSKKEQLSEGIAEYVRKFLQNRETAAIDYPLFTDYFLGCFTGRDLALIEQLADEVNAYYSLDADTATSSIRLREEGAADVRTTDEKIKAKAGVLYQAWNDSNHGIKLFDRATGANTYKLATNAAYSDAMAGQIIVGDLTDANGQYVAPGLKTALHGIDLSNEKEYRLFGEYLAVKHGPERLAEGMRIFADDRKNSTAFMEKRSAELEAQYPQFEEASERLYEFEKQLAQTWLVNTGLIPQNVFDDWYKRWEFYVPLNRAVSNDKRGIGAKRGFANQNSTVKRAHGSGLDIVHPVDNIVNNLVKMVNAGVRNNVMRTITDSARDVGADAAYLEQVPAPLERRSFDMTGVKETLTGWFEESDMQTDDKMRAAGIIGGLDDILYQYGRGKAHGDIITVLKGGEPEFWKINDPMLLASVTSMSPSKMEGILDTYAVVSRFMTSNITGNNIVWSLFSNFPRDMMTLFTYSKRKNPAKIFAAMGSGYLNKIKGDNADPMYKEFLAMGGGKTSAYTSDRDLAKKARKKLTGKVSTNPFDAIAFISDTVEMGPRYATYKLMRENGMNPQEAFYEAMDVTVNFRRGGTISREINKVVPFFNASVQGLDKFRRWITAEELAGKPDRAKVIRSRVIQHITVNLALAAIFYALNNGTDENEENYEQLSNYTKNSYWNIPIGDGKYFAIPKPRELGVLSSFFETCMEYGIGENKHAFDEFYAYAVENFLPAVASDVAQVGHNGLVETGMNIIGSLGIIGVVGYLGANRDFLGKPIVSSGMQNLEPKDQYTSRTSKIAKWIGQAFNASPMQIDYFFQQTLGGWWKGMKALFPVGSENRDFTLGVRNTYIKDNQYSTDLVNWMYDRAEASSKAKASAPEDVDKAISAKMDGNMTSFYSRYYKLAKDKSDTTATRGTRQLVLDMINEYRKAVDSGTLTKTQEAVNDICRSMGSTEYLPGVMQPEVKDGNGVKHALSDAQYVEYQTDYLRLYWETVEDALPGAQTDKEKAAIVLAAKNVAKEQAAANTLKRIGGYASSFVEEYSGVSNRHVTEFLASVDIANDDGSLKQTEVVDIITDMHLSDADSYQLFFSRYDRASAYEAASYGIPAELYLTAMIEMGEIKADAKNSRRENVEAYLRSVCDDYREYLFLLGTEFPSVKKEKDYIQFFG